MEGVINLQLTLAEAANFHLLLDQIGPALREMEGLENRKRADLFKRISATLEVELKKSGAFQDSSGWVWRKQ